MTSPYIKPVGDRILLQRVKEKEEIRGGVIIPENAREKPQEAKVIALGTGRKAKDGSVSEFEVQVGDRVLVGNFAGADVRLGHEQYTLVREDDILGVIT